MILFVNGCELAPVFVLENNTSTEIQIEFPDKTTKAVGCQSKSKLSLKQMIEPSRIAGERCSIIVLRNGQRLGYFIDRPNLKVFRQHFHRADFQLNEDGKISLIKLDRQRFDTDSNQPSGFPLAAVFILEPK
jgi:hypothetical protein